MWEAAPIALPVVDEQSAFCNSRDRISTIGQQYEDTGEVSSLFVGIMMGECLVGTLSGWIVERGDTYIHNAISYQAVGISPTEGGRAMAWYLAKVDVA